MKKERIDSIGLYSQPQDARSYSQATKANELDNPSYIKPNPTVPSSNGQPKSDATSLYGTDMTGSSNNYMNAPALPQQDPNAVYMDEIQKAMSDRNYKALLQSDIAAYNLKMNTQKYLNSELAANGLNTQGYGTSAHVGVENSAANLYAQNLENYNEAEANALSQAQDRETAANTERDNQLVTYLQYSDGSEDSINNYMKNYGYVYKNGTWVNSQTGEPASSYVLSAVQAARDNAGSNAISYGISDENARTNFDAFLSAYGVGRDENGNVKGYSIDDLYKLEANATDDTTRKKLNEVVGYEIDWVKKHMGDYQNGTLLKLQRGGESREAYLFLYSNGKFYLVSTSDNEQEGGQVDTRYKEYQGPKEEIIGKPKQ